jgi:hypothetical protein
MHLEMYELKQVGVIDIGFCRCQGLDGLDNFVSHRSCVVKINDPELANYSDKTGHYIVGEDAIAFSDEQRASTDTKYFESNDFRILFLYTLQRLQNEQRKLTKTTAPTDWVLMIGLPIEFYDETLKARFVKFLMDAAKNSFGAKPPFTVNKVNVVEQPRGTLWSPKVKNLAGETVRLHKLTKVAVIDGGDGTTDLIEGYKGRIPKAERSTGLNKGASNIHTETLFAFRKKYKLDAETNVHHIDKALRGDGMFDVGVDLVNIRESKGFQEAVKSYMNAITEVMNSRWGAYNTTDAVCATGGIVAIVTPEAFIKAGIPERKLCIGSSDSNVYGFRDFFIGLLRHKNLLGG